MENINIETWPGCRFCNMDGDLDEDHLYTFRDSFDFGALGDFSADCYITKCNKEHEPTLEVNYDLVTKGGMSCSPSVRRVPIQYCPFCGRKLV